MSSDLLDQDSEMQNALQGMDSYESGSIPRPRHNSTPALKHSVGPTPRPRAHGDLSSPRPLSWSSHSRSHSTHNLPQPPARRGSEDFDAPCKFAKYLIPFCHSIVAVASRGSSSRASSSMSIEDCKSPKFAFLNDSPIFHQTTNVSMMASVM